MEPSEYDVLAALEDHHWWYVGMAAISRVLLRPVLPPPPLRLLDAGCGTGGAGRWLSEFGEVTGADLHPRALALARSKGRRRLVRADVSALPFASGSFDAVASLDVLYHADVPDEAAALNECARVLKPMGWLLLRVPAYPWLLGSHDRIVHTRRRYRRSEVAGLLGRSGFRILRLTHANSLLFAPAAAVRLWKRLTGAPPSSDLRPLPRWLNAILAGLLAWEGTLLRVMNLPFGLSILVLAARKPDAPA